MQTFRLRRARIVIVLCAFFGVAGLVCFLLPGYLFRKDFPSRFWELQGTHAWIDGNLVAIEKSKPWKQEGQRPPSTHVIGLEFKGRLGNLLFQYASLMGIAEANNLMPVIPEGLELLDYFDLDAMKVPVYILQWANSVKYSEKKGCSFEPPTMQLGANRDVFLDGYYQSWKYIQKITKSLHRQLTFKSHLRQKASTQIQRLTHTRCSSSLPACTHVGVHVRRGDMTSVKHFIDFGYVAADADYVIRAMDFFRLRFGAKERLMFVVVSDDPEWCRRELMGHGYDDVVVMEEKNSPAEDMSCPCSDEPHDLQPRQLWLVVRLDGRGPCHLLEGATPAPGSELEKLFIKEDYYLPSWTPL